MKPSNETTKIEWDVLFAPLESQLGLILAHRAFQSQHNLLCGLGLEIEGFNKRLQARNDEDKRTFLWKTGLV